MKQCMKVTEPKVTVTYRQLIDEAYEKYCELFDRNAPESKQQEVWEDYLELVEEYNTSKEQRAN